MNKKENIYKIITTAPPTRINLSTKPTHPPVLPPSTLIKHLLKQLNIGTD